MPMAYCGKDDDDVKPTSGAPSAGAPCCALVRRCNICGNINAIDLDVTPDSWKEMQLKDHTVFGVTEEEAMRLWKGAKRCNHKALIEELRTKLEAHNNGSER